MEKTQHSESLTHIAQALFHAQYELEHVFKDAKSMHHKYATLSQCLKVIKPVLYAHELCVPQILIFDKHNGSVLKTMLIHTSGEWIASYHPLDTIFNIVIMQDRKRFDWLVEQADERAARYNFVNPVQSFGGLITYAKRYSLLAMFGLEDIEQDDDGDRFSYKQKNIEKIAPQKVNPLAGDIQRIVTACNEKGIDVKEFSKFYNMKSSDAESVKKMIENLDLNISNFLNPVEAKND